MHHHRISLRGPAEDVAALTSELTLVGARPGAGDALVMSTLEGPDRWAAVSSRHPSVLLGVDGFEAYADERWTIAAANGFVNELDRSPISAPFWGVADEDGDALEHDALCRAAETVHGHPARGGPLALEAATAIGGFAAAEDAFSGDAVRELAGFALRAASPSSCAGERAFDDPLNLTRAVLRSASCEYAERPGQADWSSWSKIMLGWAARVLESACAHPIETETETPHPLALAAECLLTCCVEALVLFEHSDTPA